MDILKLDNKGRGICYVDDKITFVENALAGEDVDIKITNSKSKFNEAQVIKYNKLSDDRIKVNCPYYNECGGCEILHLKEEKELEFKKDKVKAILKKFGDIDFNIKDITSLDMHNYRNKATFHVNNDVGYFKRKSNNIVSINNCLIVDNRINDILKEIKKLNLKNIEEFVVRTTKNDTMLIIKCIGPIDPRFKELNITSIIKCLNGEYETVKGLDYITEEIDGFKFVISPNSFFQVNTSCMIKLYNQVVEYSNLKGSEKVLDLYCGTGTIGIYLSRYADSVLGIEINKSAIDDAIINKKINHIRNIDFICSDASDINEKDFNLVVVDPPRSGLSDKTINYLLDLNPNKIVYVSCDPVTLACDLKKLKEMYNIKDIKLFNMFPRTEHVETVCLLERR